MNREVSRRHEFEASKVEIELASPEDAELICEIRDEAWIDTYPNEELGITRENVRINAQGLHGEFVPRRVAWLRERTSKDNDEWVAYVGKVDGVVRGFAIASIDEKGRKFLDNMYVKPGFQGHGLGSKLMRQVLQWFGDDEDVYLEVAAYNDRAIHFYEKFGFVKTNKKVESEPDRPDFMTPIPQIEMVLSAKSE